MAVSEGFICALDRDVLDINGLGSSLLVDQQNRQTHKRARRTQDTFRDCGTFPYACPLNPSTCIMRFWLRPTRCGVLTGYVQVEAWRSGDMLPRATNRKGDRRNLRSYSGHADLDRPSNQCRSQYSTRYAGHQRAINGCGTVRRATTPCDFRNHSKRGQGRSWNERGCYHPRRRLHGFGSPKGNDLFKRRSRY
jgi:hypothetical protein